MKKLNDYQKQEIREAVALQLMQEVEDIKDDFYLSNLGMDSLDAIELIMELEKKYNINIPDALAEKVEKVEDIFTCLENCH